MPWRHEDLLVRPKGAGARSGRPRDAQERGARRLRGVACDDQALAQAARGNGLGGPQEEAGHEAPGGRDRRRAPRPLWRQLEENREATLEEHRRLWERERGVRVSVATMSRAVRRLGWTYKQRRWEPPSVTKRQGALGEAGGMGSGPAGPPSWLGS